MNHHDDHLRDAELGPVIDRLEAQRPTATALELDTIKQRVRGRVARGSGRTQPMRSRLAILSMLVLGMLLSTSGAALSISGLSGNDDNAAVSQYGKVGGEEDDDVLGEEDSGGPEGQQPDNDGTQPDRQVELGAQDDGGELPFTGFAAIPVLIGGVALFGTGLVLRKKTGEDG